MKTIKIFLIGILCLQSFNGMLLLRAEESSKINDQVEQQHNNSIENETKIVEEIESYQEDENQEDENQEKIGGNEQPIFEEKVPNPVLVSEKKSMRIGDTIEHHVSGMDIMAAEGDAIGDLQFGFFTEKSMKNQQFEKLEFPYITATDKTGLAPDEVTIYFMVLYSGGRGWIKEPVTITEEGQRVSITRDEVLKWMDDEEQEEFPTRMYYLISGSGFTSENMSIEFHGDIVLTQRIANIEKYDDNYYEFLQADVSWMFRNAFNEHNSDAYEKKTIYGFLFPETSDVVVSKIDGVTENISPGEEVELKFSITNTAVMSNHLILDVKTEGLELIESEERDDTLSNINLSETSTGFKGQIRNDDGTWKTLMSGENITFTQKFKVQDNYEKSTIEVKPGLSAANIGTDFEYNPSYTLKMNQPKSYSVRFETNGGSFIETLVGIAKGEHIYAPLKPSKEGNKFVGWYRDAALTIPWKFTTDVVTKNKVLYAKWENEETKPGSRPENGGTSSVDEKDKSEDTSSKLKLVTTGIKDNIFAYTSFLLGTTIVLLSFFRKK